MARYQPFYTMTRYFFNALPVSYSLTFYGFYELEVYLFIYLFIYFCIYVLKFEFIIISVIDYCAFVTLIKNVSILTSLLTHIMIKLTTAVICCHRYVWNISRLT